MYMSKFSNVLMSPSINLPKSIFCKFSTVKLALNYNAVKLSDTDSEVHDRTKIIPIDIAIKYLQSSSYQQTYGNNLVWEQYRRNHKGLYAPAKTRKTCIRNGKISTGNPCPICRDEFLVLDYRNINLLKQFISPQTGKILSYTKTGICQKKHFELVVAAERAMNCGLLTLDVPFRAYDYSEYYK